MSLSSGRFWRLVGCLGLFALLSACGFKPLYGTDSAAHKPSVVAQFSEIEISPIPDRIGQQMRNMLIDALHPSGAAADYKYRLNVTVREADLSLGLQQNSIATRGQARLTIQYFLVDRDSGKSLLKETLRASAGYDILTNEFGTVVSNENARLDAMQQIADDMTEHIALYFSDKK